MNVLKIYNDTYWSLLNLNDGIYRVGRKKGGCKSPNNSTKEEIERSSLSRSRRRIKDILLCNDFQYFATLTVDSKNCDRFSLQEVQDNLKKICKKIKRNNSDFKYLFVTEKHENGAFHFHGMIKNLPVYQNKYGYLSCTYFDELGYNSFSVIKDYNKAVNYILKYITKKCIRNENNQIFFCSRGLKRPSEELMIPTDLTEIFGKNVFINEYCQKKDFDIQTLSDSQKKKLLAYFNENDEYFSKDNNCITNWLKLFTNFNKYDNIRINQ